MPEIQEYDYYEGILSITIVTQRPDASPSNVLAAASLHEQYAAKARALLREYRYPLAPYLSYYRVEKIMPAGTARDIDEKNNQDILRQQFSVGFAIIDTAWTADEEIVFAFERNIEKAVHDLFAANGLPNIFIPGDEGALGESYIDIVFSTGAATNSGLWRVTS